MKFVRDVVNVEINPQWHRTWDSIDHVNLSDFSSFIQQSQTLKKPQIFLTNENTQHAQSISKYRGEIDFGKKLIDQNSLLKMQTMKDMQERGLTKSCSGDQMFRKGEREKRENLLIPSIALYFTSRDTHMHVSIQ